MVAESDNNQDKALEEALKKFVDGYLQGKQPDIDGFVKRYPGFEDVLKQRIQDLLKINTLFDTLVQVDESDFDNMEIGRDLIGQKVGNFEIEEMIGQGGMGVVYRARDTKLDRFVAIKSVPVELQTNSTAQVRFKREAKLLASLSHPNVAVIHEIIEQDEGVDYLVLEYVPGHTLDEQIAKGSLSLQDALSIALQIAKAVSAAHEHDIIHRDLKPGNIKITPDGTVKVLDFGLAKAVESEAVDQKSTVTEPGRVIGTPAYMSPEQARGKSIDRRSDIWSFGCVLYEMLTGKAPFEGETISDTLANLLQTDPDWQALPKNTPTNIRVLIRRCLEKDPNRRLHDMADARIEISETLSGTMEVLALPSEVAETPRLLRRNVILVGMVCLIAGIFIVDIILKTFMQPNPPAPRIVERLSISIPADKPLYLGSCPNCFLALSPDGTSLVYVGESDDRTTQLYVRSMDELEIKPVPGTKGAHNPFFSPDGQWVGFFTSDLKMVPLSGGQPVTLLKDVPWGAATFGSWADDGTIVFNTRHGIQKISVDGGEPETLVTLDTRDNQTIYNYPQVLPAGKGILYTKGSHIEVLLPKTGESQNVLNNATYAQYAKSSHLIFLRNSVLMAVPFDIEKRKVTGRPIPLVDQVRLDWGFSTPQIAISPTGNIVYLSGPEFSKKALVWVDRQGVSEPLAVPAPYYFTPHLSPDGQYVAVTVMSSNKFNPQVCLYNISRGVLTNFTTEGKNKYPQWSPDGKYLLFLSERSKGSGVYRKVVEGSAPAELLASEPTLLPCSLSRDGKFLACTVLDDNTQDDIWILPLDKNGKPQRFLQTRYREYNPTFSPNGRWLAYASDESGRPEIYLQEFTDGRRKIPVSTEGGIAPVWSPDGLELFYTNGNNMMVVKIRLEPDLIVEKPERLFEGLYNMGGNLGPSYDVSLDGQRFLMIPKGAAVQLIYVRNWFEELRRLAPLGKDG